MVREGLWSIDALLRPLGAISLRLELGATWSKSLRVGSPALADHPGTALQHGVHGLSRVGGHGLDDLLLPVLLRVILKVRLGVGGGHQGRASCRRGRLQHRGR